jgi:hypothetical protein
MKELPDDKTLFAILELAKKAEQKAKELSEMGDAFAKKWGRQSVDTHSVPRN